MQKSWAASLSLLPEERRNAFLGDLSENALAAMPYLWDIWAHPLHQKAPDGDWKTWVILGGRGAGKTRAGAEWVRGRIEGATPLAPGACRRMALVGETYDQARAIMVEGDSGVLACSPPDRRPKFVATQRKLVWPNGAEAMLASAHSYEALRGPQFDGIWADELAKWQNVREAWEMLQFTLRLGQDPRMVVTTTPRDEPVLREILAEPGTVVSKAGTAANAANLAPGFYEALQARFGGTWKGRQELDGDLVEQREGALWTLAGIEAGRRVAPETLDRIVVAVDPPVSSGAGSDECGIVVAGVSYAPDPKETRAYVLADRSCQGLSPKGWAERAAQAFEDFCADRLVAEVNQGGNLVEDVMRQVAPQLSYRAVHARQGKHVRAEPVAALYEQGRVHHVTVFEALERQMLAFDGAGSGRSPDRVDALVWALTDLMLTQGGAPKVRGL